MDLLAQKTLFGSSVAFMFDILNVHWTNKAFK